MNYLEATECLSDSICSMEREGENLSKAQNAAYFYLFIKKTPFFKLELINLLLCFHAFFIVVKGGCVWELKRVSRRKEKRQTMQ